MKKKELYEAPRTKITEVELENGFMKASVFEEGEGHDRGLTTEEHGFANPGAEWEGDYDEIGWDR